MSKAKKLSPQLVKQILQRIVAAAQEASASGETPGSVMPQMFFERDGRAMGLSGEAAGAFDAGMEQVRERMDEIPLSKRALEARLQTALLAIFYEPTETRTTKLTEESAKLFEFLTGLPKEWTVALPVYGFDLSKLPGWLGRIRYVRGSSPAFKRMTGRSNSRLSSVESLPEGFGVAILQVHAREARGAVEAAREQVQESLDCLNLYTDILTRLKHPSICCLPSDMRTATDVYAAEDAAGSWHISGSNIRFYDEMPLLRVRAKQARFLGIDRLHEVLRKTARTKTHERVIMAARWAGRATAAREREIAFLLFAVALESLVLGRTKNTELQYRLGLRAAGLLERTPEAREQVIKELTGLYQIRSNIVHAGAANVTDKELSRMRFYAKESVVTVLRDRELLGAATEEEMDKIFQLRVHGGRRRGTK